jgi:beta-glucanase (GH16 family)
MRKSARSHARHALPKVTVRRRLSSKLRPRRIVQIGVVAALAVALSGGAIVVQGASQKAAATDLISNGSFQNGLSGWQAGKHTRLSISAGYNSSSAVRISSTLGSPTTVTLNDRTNSVQSTIAGHVYRASAWIRVAKPEQGVALRLLQETSNWKVVGSRQTYQWRSSTAWQHVTTVYQALEGSTSLDLNVVGMQLKPGNSIDVDDVSLVDVSALPDPTPTPTGSAPGTTPNPAPSPSTSGTPSSAPTATPTPSSTPHDPSIPVPAGWHLAWSDEFSGDTLNRSNWNVENNSTYGEGNKELECLMDDPQNVSVGDGLLTITARKLDTPIKCGNNDPRFPDGRSYTSGMLTTKGKLNFEYGRFEIRAKMPTAQGVSKGIWPAFWMRPQTGGLGELDVLELIGTGKADPFSANHVVQTIHYDYVPTYPQQGNGYDLPIGDFADGFHDFMVDWEPGSITWYVDGVATYKRTISTTSWLDAAFVNNFYLRLNMAVGGNWPGSPDADTKFPARYQVDYVRIYQKGAE